MISHHKIFKVDSNKKVRVYFIEQEGSDYRMVTGVLNGKEVRSKWTTAKAKNIGRANETSPEHQASREINSRYVKKMNEGYYHFIEEAKLKPEGKFFQVMLATEVEKVKEKTSKNYPLIADPKLDGMRMTETKDENLSRKGKEIPTVPHVVESLEEFFVEHYNVRLDGEVYNHEFREDFNALMSIARKSIPSKEDLELSKEKLQYHVYDTFLINDPFMTALNRKYWIDKNVEDTEYVKKVPWQLVHNDEELERVKEQHLIDGYEGTILRSPNEPYHQKRTKHLMKVKQFITEEYVIVDILPGKGNKSDIAGSVVVMVGDVEVGCGIRGSWAHCAYLLSNRTALTRKLATIRHFGKTLDGSLRFPVCIDVDRKD